MATLAKQVIGTALIGKIIRWVAFATAILLVFQQIARRALKQKDSDDIAKQSAIGAWSPVTSNIDWCEPNYLLSFYVAEPWNAISSAVLALPGIYLFQKCWLHGMKWPCWVQAFNVTSVGIGSVFFHGTLTRWAQWVDEAPMFAATFTASAAYFSGIPGRSSRAIWLYCITWTLVVLAVMLAMVSLPGETASAVFQVAFICSALEMVHEGWRYGKACKDEPHLAHLHLFLERAVKGGSIAAFAWAADFAICDPEVISKAPFFGLSPHVLWHFAIAYATHSLAELGSYPIAGKAAQQSMGTSVRFVFFDLVPLLGENPKSS